MDALNAGADQLGKYAHQAGNGLMGALGDLQQGANNFAPNASANLEAAGHRLSEPVQNLLDSVRVLYKHLPEQYRQYITTVYPDSDQRMKSLEDRMMQGFERIKQAAVQGSQAPASDGVGGVVGQDGQTSGGLMSGQPLGSSGASPPSRGLMGSDFPPSGVHAPIADVHPAPSVGLMGKDFPPPGVHAPIAYDETHGGNMPMPPPRKPSPPERIANSETRVANPKLTPVSANRLADDASLGDAIAFFMANDNLNRDDAVQAARMYMANKVDQTIADADKKKRA